MDRHSLDSGSLGDENRPSGRLVQQQIVRCLRRRRPKPPVDRTDALKLAALPGFWAHVERHLWHLPGRPHADAGGARRRTISDGMSANVCTSRERAVAQSQDAMDFRFSPKISLTGVGLCL